MQEPRHYSPMAHAPRASSPQEQLYAALDREIASPLRALIDRLAGMYPGTTMTRRVEEAISNLESAQDNIGRELAELDGANE